MDTFVYYLGTDSAMVDTVPSCEVHKAVVPDRMVGQLDIGLDKDLEYKYKRICQLKNILLLLLISHKIFCFHAILCVKH